MRRSIRDIEQDYFHWLCEAINADHERDSYWLVLKDLHRRSFVPMIEHDDNRESDGLELREEYLRDIQADKYDRISGDCSILEMMIALAKRMDFETSAVFDGGSPKNQTSYWFWDMMHNLKLDLADDATYSQIGGREYVDAVVDDLVNREYEADGSGGLFPLTTAYEDQRDVEIWYQMAAYLNEREVV